MRDLNSVLQEDADLHVWGDLEPLAEAGEWRDGVLTCRKCMLVVGLLPSKVSVGGGQQTVRIVSEMRKKRLVRFSLRPCRHNIVNPQPVLREGQARSVLTRWGNKEFCGGKLWKFVTSGTRSKAPDKFHAQVADKRLRAMSNKASELAEPEPHRSTRRKTLSDKIGRVPAAGNEDPVRLPDLLSTVAYCLPRIQIWDVRDC